MSQRIAVVTGGNRGLGFETSLQLARLGYRVILTARDGLKAEEAARKLKDEGLDVQGRSLDVSDDESVAFFANAMKRDYPAVHVLVNNAGGVFSGATTGSPLPVVEKPSTSVLAVDLALIRQAMETNAFGALRVVRALLPLLEAGRANVVNVSTGMAGLSEMNGGSTPYRVSKTALNAITRILSQELLDRGVKVNAICPGWVRTELGGRSAPRTVEEGASGIVWAATLPADGPTGGFFRDGKAIPW